MFTRLILYSSIHQNYMYSEINRLLLCMLSAFISFSHSDGNVPLCPPEVLSTASGSYSWLVTSASDMSTLPCPMGPVNVNATRQCDAQGNWLDHDASLCVDEFDLIVTVSVHTAVLSLLHTCICYIEVTWGALLLPQLIYNVHMWPNLRKTTLQPRQQAFFVKVMITVGREIYGARGWCLYLTTVTRDVTMCADIVYGKHFRTHLSQISLVSAKTNSQVPIPGCALLENGICYRYSDFTVANSALQRGTNISISEICAKWLCLIIIIVKILRHLWDILVHIQVLVYVQLRSIWSFIRSIFVVHVQPYYGNKFDVLRSHHSVNCSTQTGIIAGENLSACWNWLTVDRHQKLSGGLADTCRGMRPCVSGWCWSTEHFFYLEFNHHGATLVAYRYLQGHIKVSTLIIIVRCENTYRRMSILTLWSDTKK